MILKLLKIISSPFCRISLVVCLMFSRDSIQVMLIKPRAVPELMLCLLCGLSGGMILVCPVTDLNSTDEAFLPVSATILNPL